MKCPFCKNESTQVIDSRVSDAGDSIRRRRRCESCSKRFTTYETVELRMPQVIKQDGTRTEFDRLYEQAASVGQKLGAFMKYLQTTDIRGQKFKGRELRVKRAVDPKRREKKQKKKQQALDERR